MTNTNMGSIILEKMVYNLHPLFNNGKPHINEISINKMVEFMDKFDENNEGQITDLINALKINLRKPVSLESEIDVEIDETFAKTFLEVCKTLNDFENKKFKIEESIWIAILKSRHAKK